MPKHGLNTHQIDTLRRILSSFAPQIESVGLFGSRATGKYKENSDIDLVIYGRLTKDYEQRIWTVLDESCLSVPVDVTLYDHIQHPLLKNHIDTVMMPLFSQRELLVASVAKKHATSRPQTGSNLGSFSEQSAKAFGHLG